MIVMDGILVINKPAGMTSHDVVNFLRRHYHQKKFGHTGTLDPDATGVLLVLCGKACKVLQFLNDTDKSYQAEIQLGYSTTTDDISGEILEQKEVNTDFDFDEVLNSFKGPLHQKVPATSNKKVNGQKLIDLQRKGAVVPDVYQDIEVYDIHAIGKLAFEVHCSSGTYVRSICRDFALKTKNLGCMKSLVRTSVGRFRLEQAQSLDELKSADPILYPVQMLLDHLPMVEYETILDVYQGKRIQLETDANRVCICDQGEPVAIYDREKDDIFKSKRGLW